MSRNEYMPFLSKIVKVRKHTEIEYTFTMIYEGEVKPGQFFEVSIPKYGEAPISVSGIGDGTVDLTIRRVGKVTNEIFERYEGDSIFMRGPYGNGFDYEDYRGGELVVVAGGTGVSPVRGVIRYFADHPEERGDMTLIAGFKSPEDVLFKDIERVVESGTSQTTFYPLMASPSVARSLARTVGKVDYAREQRFYEIISEVLAGGENPLFEHGSAWTFNKRGTGAAGEGAMIDEYVVDYEEYPAIGSGGITYLGNNLYVNTFSVNDYNDAIEHDRMSLMGKATFSKHDQMRYRFMMQLFGLRLDKRQFKKDFGVSVERGLPVEMAFMKASGAFDRDNADELTLTPKGRYLMVVMMRQFFIGVNNLRDQARAALVGEERELIFGDGK